jgi:hypothetical protein
MDLATLSSLSHDEIKKIAQGKGIKSTGKGVTKDNLILQLSGQRKHILTQAASRGRDQAPGLAHDSSNERKSSGPFSSNYIPPSLARGPFSSILDDEPLGAIEEEPEQMSRRTTRAKPLKRAPGSKTRKRAAEKIQNFFKKTGTPRRLQYLNTVCADSGECVAFGKGIDAMKQLFYNFDFQYIDNGKIKRIGEPSANGFVMEIPYKREDYTVYTVLKSSLSSESDNLFYEAFVGIYINKMTVAYPCFLETYGSFIYNDDSLHEDFGNGNATSRDKITNGLVESTRLNYDSFFDNRHIDYSCEHSIYCAVLIQHVKNAKSMLKLFRNNVRDKDFLTVHLVSFLYQIYCPLAELSDTFTHYDLHPGNVVVFIPSSRETFDTMDKYIRMIYNYPDGSTVEFNTFGVAKIIDYGRSYMKDGGMNSGKFYQKLCERKACDTYHRFRKSEKISKCGEDFGYGFMEEETPEGISHYISSIKRNKSHDLRLLNEFRNTSSDKYRGKNSERIREILNNVVYSDSYLVSRGEPEYGFGTREVERSNYREFGDAIENVEDAHLALKKLIKEDPYFTSENNRIFQGKTKIGEMHIWVDRSRPMEYITEP